MEGSPRVKCRLIGMADLVLSSASEQVDAMTTFRRPARVELPCPVLPRLESWMKHDHPDRVRLDDYLDAGVPTLEPHLIAGGGNAIELAIEARDAPRPDASGSEPGSKLRWRRTPPLGVKR
jgi:hypothetical protein